MSQFHFQHPTTIVLAGPTQCGKTHFLITAIRKQCFKPEPQRIVWVYGEMQSAYEELVRDAPVPIQFIKGFTTELYETFDPGVRNLLILDDQMENKAVHKRGDNSVTKFFTQGSHHRNLTVVYIVQNLFNQDASLRTISLNTHYMVLFKNPRDATQIRTLSQQMYPENSRMLIDAYRDATSQPYGYLLLNLRPDACDALRILTDVFDKQPTAYVPANDVNKAQRV
jgi:hypothetical protein